MSQEPRYNIHVSISFRQAIDAVGDIALNGDAEMFCEYDAERLERYVKWIRNKLSGGNK